MLEERMENNRVCLEGKIASGFSYSHEMYGEKFYRTDILVCRASDFKDSIPVMVSQKLVDMDGAHLSDYIGCDVKVIGQFRSYNKHEEEKRRLELFVFVQEFSFQEEECRGCEHNNQIFLRGYLCKPPVYRRTPKGKKIADILLAVNRPYGKSDYIPCIVWGRNAVLAARLKVGSAVRVSGRIQSREYTKVLSDEESETRVAYEVSAQVLEMGTEVEEINHEDTNCQA